MSTILASPAVLTTVVLTTAVVVIRLASALLRVQSRNFRLEGPDRIVVHYASPDNRFLVRSAQSLQDDLKITDEFLICLGETIVARWVGWCIPRVQLLY